jgi:glycosyltransferase involved in cell wall biosynthesis
MDNSLGPQVTICIPVFNCQKYIHQAIESVIAQTFRNWEMVIVNNASTDCTLEIIHSYSDPRIRIINNEKNIGLEANWNKAVSAAQGKYIKLLPADDF